MEFWNKRNVKITLEEMKKELIPIYRGNSVIDRTGKGRTKQDIAMYGQTYVNEIGTKGSFETGTAGLADFFDSSINASSVELNSDCLFGSFAQKVISDGTAIQSGCRADDVFADCGDTGDVLFISCFGKTSKNFKIIANTGTGDFNEIESAGKYVKNSLVITIGDLTNDYIELLVSDDETLTGSDYGLFDGLQIINLTRMGYMPVQI